MGAVTRPRDIDHEIHGGCDTVDFDRAIGALAERQAGVVDRSQLRGLGLGKGAIDHRVKRRLLVPYHWGVYAVGHGAVSKEGHWMAAVLAGGPGAVLSHRSAAELWGLRPGQTAPIEITTQKRRRPRPGLTPHCSSLPPDERTTTNGIPATTVPRTILDEAATATTRQVERMINEADVQHLWDRLSLDDLLRRYPNRAGSATVREALLGRRAGATLTKSELEEMFIGFLDEFGLPRPEINATLMVNGSGLEPDCLWREQRLVVELDSRRFHHTPRAFESDRERDRRLAVDDWRTIRVTGRMLRADRRIRLADDLAQLLSASSARSRPRPRSARANPRR
jgi:hypothetical protein